MLMQECGFFDKWILSTESDKVIQVALNYGFKESYRRPVELATEKSSVWDAVRHALESGIVLKTDIVVLLHPTSPCLRKETVTEFISHFVHVFNTIDALVSVNETGPYVWSQGERVDFSGENSTENCLKKYMLNNALFAFKWETAFKHDNLYESAWAPYVIPPDEAIDIDNETDLQMAEAVLQWRQRYEAKTEKSLTGYL
jgi:CMP-N-acetylneuraminic acid synthetase